MSPRRFVALVTCIALTGCVESVDPAETDTPCCDDTGTFEDDDTQVDIDTQVDGDTDDDTDGDTDALVVIEPTLHHYIQLTRIDSDGDGLWDDLEPGLGLNPTMNDSNGDHITDALDHLGAEPALLHEDIAEWIWFDPRIPSSPIAGLHSPSTLDNHVTWAQRQVDLPHSRHFCTLGPTAVCGGVDIPSYFGEWSTLSIRYQQEAAVVQWYGMTAEFEGHYGQTIYTDYNATTHPFRMPAGASTNPTFGPDPDGDTLIAYAEFVLGTDPAKWDTDDDGLPDDVELAQRTNPLSADTDSDGLSDGDELAADTPSNDGDSDRDGIPDTDERALGTLPDQWDSDNDGIPDGYELQVGTNPRNPDINRDGLIDGLPLRGTPTPFSPVDGFEMLAYDMRATLNGSWPNYTPAGDRFGYGAMVKHQLGGTYMRIMLVSSSRVRCAQARLAYRCSNSESAYSGMFITDSTQGAMVYWSYPRYMASFPVTTTACVPGPALGGDTDGDGLTDAEEQTLGTDPLCVDSDEDLLPDGFEVRIETDPMLPDTDGDGVLDGEQWWYDG